MTRARIATCLVLLASTAGAQSTLVSVVTTPASPYSATQSYVHCAHGFDWVAVHSGTEPVLFSSRDGTSWTNRGAIFSSIAPAATGEWAVRFSRDELVAIGHAADTRRYYRHGRLQSDGTVLWSSVEQAADGVDSTWTKVSLAVGSGRAAFWRAGTSNLDEGTLRIAGALYPATWTKPAASVPELAPTSLGAFSGGALLPAGGTGAGDLLILRATTSSTYGSGQHRLVALKFAGGSGAFDASWYDVSRLGGALAESMDTEVWVGGDVGAHQRFAAVNDSSQNTHAVYVNRNGRVAHYRKWAGLNNAWSRISADATGSALTDRVALTATAGRQLLLVYSKSDDTLYYRRFDGASWGGESLLVAAGTLNAALGVAESTGDCRASVVWNETSGPTTRVMFFANLGDSPELRVLGSPGAFTVTAPNSFELVFSELAGGAVREFYDLQEDPSRTYDLAAGVSNTEGFPTAVIFAADGFWYSSAQNETLPRLEILEATPTRVRLRQEAFFEEEEGSRILAGARGIGDYTTYGAGKLAYRWEQRCTSPVSVQEADFNLNLHYLAAGPLSTWAQFSQSGNAFALPGTDDFTLAVSDAAGVKTDFLNVLHRDWSVADGHPETADSVWGYKNATHERSHVEWRQLTNTVIPVGTEQWSFLAFFKPTTFVNHLDPAVAARAQDYRDPALPSLVQGGGWFDSQESTLGPSDYFNEAEAAYAFDLDPTTGLVFELTGAPTPRHAPAFKIRRWRSLGDPTRVTLAGRTLVNEVDFKADVKPIAQAFLADATRWHSTLASALAVTSPDVGAPGTVTNADFVAAGRFGGAARFDLDGEYLSLPQAGNFSTAEGTLEVWYQPSYPFGGDLGNVNDRFGLFGYWIDANNYFRAYHQPSSGALTDDGLRFELASGGTVYQAVTGADAAVPRFWRAGDWVHLRFVWKASATAPRLEIYVNGVLASRAPAGTYVTPVPAAASLFVGDRAEGGAFSGSAQGLLDELHLYSSANPPTQLARGGLTRDAAEYLAEATRNAPLALAGVDAVGRGPRLYLGLDSKFRGLNVVLATPGSNIASGALAWEYWSATTGWSNLEATVGFLDSTNSFTGSGVVSWDGDPAGWSPYSVNGGPELFYVRASLPTGAAYSQVPVEERILSDVLVFTYRGDVTAAAQRFSFSPPSFAPPEAPSVDTLTPTSVTPTAATLAGSARPNGDPTTGWLRYGTADPGGCDDAFGTRLPDAGGTALGGGTVPTAFFENVGGLTPGTQYFVCAVGSNSVGFGFGPVISFSTPGADGGPAGDGGLQDGGSDGGAGDGGAQDGGVDGGASEDAGSAAEDGGSPDQPDAGGLLEVRYLRVGCGCGSSTPWLPWSALPLWLLWRRRRLAGVNPGAWPSPGPRPSAR